MTLLTLIAEAPAAASAGVQVWARTVPDLFDDEVHAHADEVVTKTGLLQYMEGQAGLPLLSRVSTHTTGTHRPPHPALNTAINTLLPTSPYLT